MQRSGVRFLLLAAVCLMPVRAVLGQAVLGQAVVCQVVAQHLWSQVATAPLAWQTPLAELMTAAPGSFKPGATDLAHAGRSIADTLAQDHAADERFARILADRAPETAARLGDSSVWLLDKVEGSLGCHTPMTVVVPPDKAAHEIGLPGNPDPGSLCGLSALAAVTVDGTPALWIEQSGAFSSSLEESRISLAAVRGDGFDAPCTVTVDYAVTDQATHAFCDGIDCVPLQRRAEVLAKRLRQQETAESLGAGVLAGAKDEADYRRMAEAAGTEGALPTFGVTLDVADLRFADQMVFPVRLDDGVVYLGRIGHGGIGWRTTANTLLALYRMKGEQVVPAASVFVAARRSGIEGVGVR